MDNPENVPEVWNVGWWVGMIPVKNNEKAPYLVSLGLRYSVVSDCPVSPVCSQLDIDNKIIRTLRWKNLMQRDWKETNCIRN